MARLIDADKLIEELRKDKESVYSHVFCHTDCQHEDELQMDLEQFIENQPTVYDVEKVVEELEEEKQRLRNLKNDCIALCDSEVIAIEESAYNFAIDIVRKGGLE